MRILITGASGLVGSACARLAGELGHEAIGTVGRWSGPVPGATELHAADLGNREATVALIRGIKPDCILNTAAVAEPAVCDADPLHAQQLNVGLPVLLAGEAGRTGARLLHLSSEQVFDGEHAPYSASDPPHPLNLYGRQKAESEQRVLALAPQSCVVRPPLLLGNSLGGQRSTHERMFEAWAAGRRVKLYTDEIRQVCGVDNLAGALLELALRRDLSGIFHWAGTEAVSRWTLGRRIAAHFSVAEKWLEPMARAETAAISAKRPRDLSLKLAPLDNLLRTKPAGLEAAIKGLTVPPAFAAWHRAQ
jgi:dTDP-4-dehydrorhamnose reductase